MCITIMTKAISEAFRDLMSEKATTAKLLLTELKQRFVKNEKAKINNALDKPNFNNV